MSATPDNTFAEPEQLIADLICSGSGAGCAYRLSR
jgi:hypothetical protein